MGILIIILICILIWKGWGMLFDGEPNPMKEIKPRTEKRLKLWIREAEDVLRDPTSTKEQRENAIRDIEYLGKVLSEIGVEV